MNPILVLSAFGVAILLWFVLAFTFKPIGILFGKLFADAIEAMEEENKGKEREKNNE